MACTTAGRLSKPPTWPSDGRSLQTRSVLENMILSVDKLIFRLLVMAVTRHGSPTPPPVKFSVSSSTQLDAWHMDLGYVGVVQIEELNPQFTSDDCPVG